LGTVKVSRKIIKDQFLKLIRGSLQFKILLVVLVVALFHASITAVLFATRVKNQITIATRESMLNSLRLTQEKILSELTRRAEITNNLASQINNLTPLPADPVTRERVIRRRLANFLTNLHRPPLYVLPFPQAAYVFFPEDGQFVCSGQNWTVADLKQRPWWRQVLRGQDPTESLGYQVISESVLVNACFIGDLRLTPGPATLPIYRVANDGKRTMVVGIDYTADLTTTPTGAAFTFVDIYGELYSYQGVLLALPTSEGNNNEKYLL
jgi:hypothetical protein